MKKLIYLLLFLSTIISPCLNAQVITITTPNGGENWQNSINYGIVWVDDVLGSVKIELYKNEVLHYLIAGSAQSNGFYLWTPNVAESGTDYKIKITSNSDSSIFDYSDDNFSISKSVIIISYPNGGEMLKTGTENSIVWADDIPGSVKIELFKSDNFYSTIIDTTPSNGFYLWAVPNTIPGGSDFKLKITSLASSNDFDFSDNNFSIDNTTGIDDFLDQMPDEFTLMQNYPNPFNPATNIVFGLPFAGDVTIVLFNAIGQKVDVIFNSYREAGYHQIEFNAEALNSGVYFYRIQVSSRQGQSFSDTKKMMILK